MVDQRCAFASESAPAGFPKAAVSAWEANDGFVRTPTFDPIKCCAMDESPLRRAAAQHVD